MNMGSQIVTAADFGFQLRSEREARGITQAKLAEMANVSVRWLSNFERGQSPRAELVKVMHVFRALDLAFEVVEKRKPQLSATQKQVMDAFSTVSRAVGTSAAEVATEVVSNSLQGNVSDMMKQATAANDIGVRAVREALAGGTFGADLLKQASAANDIGVKAVRDAVAAGSFSADLMKQVSAANDISVRVVREALAGGTFGADLIQSALASQHTARGTISTETGDDAETGQRDEPQSSEGDPNGDS